MKFKVKLEYSVKGQKHFKEVCYFTSVFFIRSFVIILQLEMKNLWALAIGGEGSERVALNSSS